MLFCSDQNRIDFQIGTAKRIAAVFFFGDLRNISGVPVLLKILGNFFYQFVQSTIGDKRGIVRNGDLLRASGLEACDGGAAAERFGGDHGEGFLLAGQHGHIRHGVVFCQESLVGDFAKENHVVRGLDALVTGSGNEDFDIFRLQPLSKLENVVATFDVSGISAEMGGGVEDHLFLRKTVCVPEFSSVIRMENIGIHAVEDDAVLFVRQNRGLLGPFHEPGRNGGDDQVFIEPLKSFPHFSEGKGCVVQKQGLGFLPQPGTITAAGFPAVAVKGVAAVCGVHKLGMEGQNGFDPVLFQPGYHPVDIYKIPIDAMQMHHIGPLLPDNPEKPVGRKEAAAVHKPRDSA